MELSGFLYRHGVPTHFCTSEERHGSGRDLLAILAEATLPVLLACERTSNFPDRQ